MLIVVVSDTHGNENTILKIRNEIKERNVNYMIHLGDNIDDAEKIVDGLDCTFYGVKGNCDLANFPDELIVKIENKKFFITHGHKYGVKMGLNNIFYKGKEVEVDAVLFGHTHIKIISKEDGLWIINPGSPSLPKDRVPSIAFIEIKGNEIYPSSFTIK